MYLVSFKNKIHYTDFCVVLFYKCCWLWCWSSPASCTAAYIFFAHPSPVSVL